MTLLRTLTIATGLQTSVTLALAGAASAQAPGGDHGQRVGNSYVPSAHDAGCVGLL